MASKLYYIRYNPIMGESGFISSVDWDKKTFHYNSPTPYNDKMFSSEDRDRLFKTFPHLSFTSLEA